VIKATIFDLDGTLVDSNDLHTAAWEETFRHFGKEIPYQELRQQIGKGGDQYLPVFLTEVELRTIGPEVDHYRAKLFRKKYLEQVRPFPKVRELFEQLRKDGKRIALAIGDTPYDVQSAKKLDLGSVAMLCGGFAEDELRASGALAIYRDPADLLENYWRSSLA